MRPAQMVVTYDHPERMVAVSTRASALRLRRVRVATAPPKSTEEPHSVGGRSNLPVLVLGVWTV